VSIKLFDDDTGSSLWPTFAGFPGGQQVRHLRADRARACSGRRAFPRSSG
jgi:uncharacterized protein YbdZ (MbtH family)